MISGTLLLGVGWAVCLPPLFKHLVSPQYGAALQQSLILILAQVITGFYLLGVSHLIFWKKTRLIALSSSTGAVANLTLNLLLIPHYQALGACWAQVAGKLVTTMMIFYVVWRVSGQKKS
jgi:O-antigen/teichoic acid export membrane protein